MTENICCENQKPRITQKAHMPSEAFVRRFMGEDAWARLARFEELLGERYDLSREMRFPFGSEYGWGFRYAHKKSLLCYVFFEKGGFCCTISINDTGAQKVKAMFGDLHPAIQSIWRNRYPCGSDGGWLHCSVAEDDVLPDLVGLVSIKVKPGRPPSSHA